MTDRTAAERMRRSRARQKAEKEGRFWVSFEVTPELTDALETAYQVQIDSAADAAAVIVRALVMWSDDLDRLTPKPFGVARNGGTDRAVVNRSRKEQECLE